MKPCRALTASLIVWEMHGSPAVSGAVECSGRCYVCALPITRGVPVSKAIGDNFTDHSRCRAPNGTHVCAGCCYVMSRTSPGRSRRGQPVPVARGTIVP